MEISYFPGCTLKTKAVNFENTALAVLKKFDIDAKELNNWFCCGAVFSLASDNLMYQLSSIRTLIKAKETGNKRLLTLCSMCYNTLKRAALLVQNDEEKRKKINDFMYKEETEFNGDEVEVVHILKLFEEIGLEKIENNVEKKVNGLKVAPYYGCLLLRPKEIAIDSPEDPAIMENILEAAGCESVYFPFKTECCASYQIVNKKEIVMERTKKIVRSALKNGADLIVLNCPLCDFNLDAVQEELKLSDSNFETIPVLYFTQLIALIMGIDPEINDFALHNVDPRPLLEKKGLL